MNGTDYIKGACGQCGGHLEFSPEAVGQEIECPHCGQKTILAAPVARHLPAKQPWMFAVLALVVFLAIAAAAVGWFIKEKPVTVVKPEPPVAVVSPLTNSFPTNSPPARHTNNVTAKPTGFSETTNAFAYSGMQLQKTPGTSLVYVTGKIKNLAQRQRFGVKVELKLLDAKKKVVGKATDYQPVMDPHSVWTFKALVMESKTVSAKLDGIQEDQ